MDEPPPPSPTLHQAALNLPGCPQFIQLNSFTSQPPSVTSGVPQGSILGPSLFYSLPASLWHNFPPINLHSLFRLIHTKHGKIQARMHCTCTSQQEVFFLPGAVYRWYECTVGYSSARVEEKTSQEHTFLRSISIQLTAVLNFTGTTLQRVALIHHTLPTLKQHLSHWMNQLHWINELADMHIHGTIISFFAFYTLHHSDLTWLL